MGAKMGRAILAMTVLVVGWPASMVLAVTFHGAAWAAGGLIALAMTFPLLVFLIGAPLALLLQSVAPKRERADPRLIGDLERELFPEYRMNRERE